MDGHNLTKGNIYLILSYILFYLSSYLIHFILARTLNPANYGTIGVILTLMTVIQIFLINGIPTASSKYLSEGIDGKQIKKTTLSLQFIYAIILSIIVYVNASNIANLLNDKSLTPYIKYIPIVILIRSINQLYGSFFNGYREFKKQAMHMAIDTIPRVIFVCIFVIYLQYGIYGVLDGYALASLIGLGYGVIFLKDKITKRYINYKKIAKFSIQIILFSLFYQLISSLDLFFIKASDLSDDYVGFYTSARVLSTMFTIVSASLSLTLLPSVSHTFYNNNYIEAKYYIKTSLRYLLITFLPVAVIVSVYSRKILELLFTVEYGYAGNALSILIWGWLFLSIFEVFSALINASGKPEIPSKIVFIGFCISLLCNTFFIKYYGIEGGAISTLIASVICCLGGAYYVYKIFGEFIEIYSALKIILGVFLLYIGCIIMNCGGIYFYMWISLLLCMYIFYLLIVKVITNKDINIVRDILKNVIRNDYLVRN